MMFPGEPFEHKEIAVEWSPLSFFANRVLRFFQKKRVQPLKTTVSSADISNDLTTYIRALFHDFRGPLNNISLSVDYLMVHNPPDSRGYDELLCIRDACTVLGDSLDGFLGVNEMKPLNLDTLELNLEPFNIVGLIKKIQYILLFDIRNKNIHINCNTDVLQEWVIGDYKLLQMVLVKLVSNAIKNGEMSASVSLNLVCIKKYSHNNHHIRITIVDNNAYIKTLNKAKMFDKRPPNEPDGCLYICKRIIELHGGTIIHRYFNLGSIEDIVHIKDLKISERRGNVFQIDLTMNICPSSEKALQSAVSSRKAQLPSNSNATNSLLIGAKESLQHSLRNALTMMNHPQKKRGGSVNSINSGTNTNVMVVDDSEISRKLLDRLIGSVCKDTKIHTAIDGLDALVKFIGFSETDVQIHMVLVDNVMPNLTGELFCKILRGIGYNGIIIGITGNGVQQDQEKFQENGADYVFIKPFTKKNLESILELVNREGYVSRTGHKLKERIQGTLTWVEDSYP